MVSNRTPARTDLLAKPMDRSAQRTLRRAIFPGNSVELLDEILDLVQDPLQAAPTFQTPRLYCRVSAAEVAKKWIDCKGDPAKQVSSIQTIATKRNLLGVPASTTGQARAPKNPQGTDAIFEQLSKVRQHPAPFKDTLRLTLDAKTPSSTVRSPEEERVERWDSIRG